MDLSKKSSTTQMHLDIKNMEQTIELAMNGSGFVNPEPLEGGMICIGDRIIEKAFRSSVHMENSVLEQLFLQFEASTASVEIQSDQHHEAPLVGVNTQPFTVYLNIEPEIHMQDVMLITMFQKYKALGLERIVIGLRRLIDAPVQSTIYKVMRQCNIEIVEGICEEACRELNEIYLHFIVHKTPFVFVKWAMTLDGKIATRTGDSKWISSDESLTFVHVLRQRVAAILVGEGTVRTDNPKLTTRLNIDKVSHPLRVIVTRYGDIPDDSYVLQVDDYIKTLLIVSEQITPVRMQFFLDKGVQVLKISEENGRLPMKVIVERLGDLGIDSLYIEGGSAILGDAFDSGIIHKVYTAVAPKIVGGKSAFTPVGGTGIEKMSDAIELQRVMYEIIGPDIIIKGYIK